MHHNEPSVNSSAMKLIPMETAPVADTQYTSTHRMDGLTALAHDARNMLAALDLYCDLLGEPGVLSPSHLHYGDELKMVAASSRRLVEKMGVLAIRSAHAVPDSGATSAHAASQHATLGQGLAQPSVPRWKDLPELPIENIAEELRGCRNLLTALAGPSITVTFDVRECAFPVEMTGEDLIRVLVNLVRNASEAMTGDGRIRISLREIPTETNTNRWIALTVEDNGPGIPLHALEAIFEPGYTTRGIGHEGSTPGLWPVSHRGVGLSIARSIVEGAGGCMYAAVRDPSGACFQMQLPVKNAS
ncbi:MAG: sensor histidine kinase [Terracidiphilus sp.]